MYYWSCRFFIFLDELRDTDGKMKQLLATELYGMGADAPDVKGIMHIGSPNSLESKICFIFKPFKCDKSSLKTF